jgi:multiple sugar transport system permease protein
MTESPEVLKNPLPNPLPGYREREWKAFISLRIAVILFAIFIALLAIWTWQQTSYKTIDGRKEIVAWGINFLGPDIYTLIHQFEKENPEYRVIISASAERDNTADNQRLLSAIAGGVPPDVYFFSRFATGEWASRDALSDLTDLVANQANDNPNRIDLNDYYDFAVQEASYAPPGSKERARLYGIPITADIRFLFVNAQALREAGLVDANGNPVPPKTWEELREYAKKLTTYRKPGDLKSGITRMGFVPGFGIGFGNSFLYLWAWQAGGSLMSADGTRVTFDSPEVVRALKYVVDIHDDAGGAAQINAFQQSISSMEMDPFIRGQIAMKIDNDWMFRFMALFKPDMDFIIAPPPMPADELAKGRKPVTWAGGFSLVIPKSAKNRDGAFKLIQYIASWRGTQQLERGKRELAESEGRIYLPEGLANRKHFERLTQEAIFDNPRVPQTFKNAYQVLRDLMPESKFRPVTPIGQFLWNQQVRAFESASRHEYDEQAKKTGEDPILLALRAAQNPAQRQLDDILKPPPPTIVNWTPWIALYSVIIVLPIILIWWTYHRRRKIEGYRKSEVLAGMFFVAPWWIGFSLLIGGPIVFSIVFSFTRYDVLSPARYVGWQNYIDVLRDPLFYTSIANTAFMIVRVPLGMFLSLGLALLLNRSLRSIGFYRSAFFMPAIVPMVAASMLWMWVFNPLQGPINQVLSWIGIAGPLWLQDPNWSKPALVLVNLWMAGSGTIIWLAGLQSIPPQLYEAASIDGANRWQQFRNVTIPMLSPFILFNAIIGTITTMQIFVESYIMTPNGQPADSTLFYAYYLFKQAFEYFRMGPASAMAWLLLLVVLVLTILQLWISKRWVHYEQT